MISLRESIHLFFIIHPKCGFFLLLQSDEVFAYYTSCPLENIVFTQFHTWADHTLSFLLYPLIKKRMVPPCV